MNLIKGAFMKLLPLITFFLFASSYFFTGQTFHPSRTPSSVENECKTVELQIDEDCVKKQPEELKTLKEKIANL